MSAVDNSKVINAFYLKWNSPSHANHRTIGGPTTLECLPTYIPRRDQPDTAGEIEAIPDDGCRRWISALSGERMDGR